MASTEERLEDVEAHLGTLQDEIQWLNTEIRRNFSSWRIRFNECSTRIVSNQRLKAMMTSTREGGSSVYRNPSPHTQCDGPLNHFVPTPFYTVTSNWIYRVLMAEIRRSGSVRQNNTFLTRRSHRMNMWAWQLTTSRRKLTNGGKRRQRLSELIHKTHIGKSSNMSCGQDSVQHKAKTSMKLYQKYDKRGPCGITNVDSSSYKTKSATGRRKRLLERISAAWT